MNGVIPAVVFCDPDGAGLGPGTSPRDAPAILERFEAEQIRLVLCSDRTRAEIESIRHDLGLMHPFICEGGSAAFVSGGYFGRRLDGTREVAGYEAIEFARPYEEVAQALQHAASRLAIEITAFSGMSVEQVARECGLTLLQARLAKLREYVEPFRFANHNAVAPARLVKALGAAGLHCLARGAYHHVGSVADNGAAVMVLSSLYRIVLGPVLTVGVGREAEDEALLRRVDVRVVRPPAAGDELAAFTDAIVRAVQHARAARIPERAAHRAS